MDAVRRLVVVSMVLLGAPAPARAAPERSGWLSYALELPGTFAGWLADADLGATTIPVEARRQSGGSAATDRAWAKATPITVELDSPPAPGVLAWMENFLGGGDARLTGAVLIAGAGDRVVRAKLYFYDAVLTKLTLSKVDATTRVPVKLRLEFQPASTRFELLPGGPALPPEQAAAPWSGTAFRLALGGPGDPLVAKSFGPISCTRDLRTLVAIQGQQQVALPPFRCDPIEAGVAWPALAPWLAWADRGFRGDVTYRPATLTLLSPDLRQVLFTVTLSSGYVQSFAPRAPRRIDDLETLSSMGLSFEQVRFQFGAQAARSTTLVPAVPVPGLPLQGAPLQGVPAPAPGPGKK